MHTGETWRLGHRPALDGLRGIAVLLVMVSHAAPARLGPAGPVGVTIFFVLSGFLITSLLLEEQDRDSRINFARFYARRARRLLPALVVMVAAVAIASVFVRGLTTPGGVIAALFYFANIVKAQGASANLGALGHTWSLSVEEQFYLLWPLTVVSVIRFGRRAVAGVATVGIIASVVFRVLAWDGWGSYYRVNYNSLSRADGLLLGCLLAVAMPAIARARPTLPAGVLMVGAVAWTFTDGWWRVVALPTVVAVLAAGLIVAVIDRPGWLGVGGLQWCGRRSYGLYLWHYPVAFLLELVAPGLPWWVPVIVVLTVPFVLAEVSWRFVETPFLRKKDRVLVGPAPAAAAAT